MNDEFKKSNQGTETRYVLEDSATVTTGAVATSPSALGKVQKRGNILAQEADKKKEAPKPRNFVAKNAKMGGAGKMKDKAKTIPRKEKHKKAIAEGFNGEYDDEAGMAHSNLLTTARAVMGLLKTIKDRDNLPEWGQEKIAKAEMMLVSVWDYLQSQKQMGNDPQQGMAEGERTMSRAAKGHEKYGKAGMAALAKAGRDGAGEKKLDAIRDKHDNYNEDSDPCWDTHKMVGTKKKGGKSVPNCVPKESIEEGSVKELMYDLKTMSDEEFVAQYKMSKAEARKQASSVSEVAPPGWEKTVKAMKKHKDIDNPFALAWSMKNKGYKSHKKESVDPYFESLDNKLDDLKKKN